MKIMKEKEKIDYGSYQTSATQCHRNHFTWMVAFDITELAISNADFPIAP